MQQLLYKKIANLTVIELLDFAEMYSIMKFPTVNLEDFCKITQRSKRHVYEALEIGEIPEELIVDGYQYRKHRKSPIFHSKAVLDWINTKGIKTDLSTHKTSNKIDDEIEEFIKHRL